MDKKGRITRKLIIGIIGMFISQGIAIVGCVKHDLYIVWLAAAAIWISAIIAWLPEDL
jgi:hypothetical protein